MKRISGNMLTLLGLIIGIASGLGVVAFKEYLVGEIVQALEEEVVASCPTCSLTYDSFSISFLTLSGRATNVKIKEGEHPKLSFDEITATFSIGEILQQKIYLESLVLSRGFADGVGPDSVTFRFIDQLTTPLPPEKQQEERWRAVLNNLEVRSSALQESFGMSALIGQNVGLFVKRIGDDFVILPALKDVRYRSYRNAEKSEFSDLYLGQLSGSVVIEEARTVFNSLRIGRELSSIDLQGSADSAANDALSGTAGFRIKTEYIGLPDWLEGVLLGSGELRGTLGSPIIEAQISHAPEDPLSLAMPNASRVPLSSAEGEVTIDVNHGDPVVTLRSFTGSGKNSSITSTQPLTFSDKGLSAGFDVSLPFFSYGPFSITQSKAHVAISPKKDGTSTTLNVQTTDLKVQNASLGPANLAISIDQDEIRVGVESSDPRFGSFRWDGRIDLTQAEPSLKDGKLTLTDYRHPLSSPPDPTRLSPLSLTASIPLSGPLDLARLNGEGPTSVSFPNLPSGLTMSGKSSLKDGLLTINLPVSAHKGTTNLKLDLARTFNGKLSVSLPGLPLSYFMRDADCGVVDASMEYSFGVSAPLAGSGNLLISDLSVGCEPYIMRVPRNSTIPISQGTLRFKGLKIASGDTTLELNGAFGIEPGADLSVAGDLYLSSLLPLLPAVDNLQGRLSTKVAIKGPLASPRFTGTAALTNGELAVASPDIEAHDVRGRFTLSEDTINVESLTGSANSGTFSVKGALLPFNWPKSKLSAELKEVTIEPMTDAAITFSGNLALGPNKDKHQALSGDISVEFAEISKDFDLNRILIQTIKGYFIPNRVQPQVSKQPVSLDLDVRLSAPRNIFVLTPFFSAELTADIHAAGTTTEPALTGSMQLLSGWIGLKGNRFDVTAGSLLFKPGSFTPYLEITSEGTLRAPTGENVLVILDASGPLTSPRISLSSDRGLSQEELLLLITSSRSLTGRTMANRVGTQFGRDERFFFSPSAFSSFEAFFSMLTKIDTFSFEPTYNPYTGLVEPAVVAKKNLSPRFALVGNNLFSSVSNSRAGVVYNISPSLDVNGFVQSVSTQDNIILSSDLTYTILAEHPSLVDITMEGNEAIDEQDILAAARIGRESRIKNQADSLSTIQRDSTSYLRDQGFIGASTTVECPHAEEFCQELHIQVHEGARYALQNIQFTGDPLPDAVRPIITSLAKTGDVATSTILRDVEQKLVIALRNEGYIAARVSPSYVPTSSTNLVDLSIRADLREPISFIFSGNTVFSAEQFLESIDLFSRKRPFGNNTVKLLVQNIEQMYQTSGYLFAQVSYTEDRSNPSRLTYRIAISEEAQTKVRDLSIIGDASISMRRIKKGMRRLGFGDQEDLLSPTYAIPSELDSLENILESIFQEEGYPNVNVSYTIEPVENGTALDITYRIRLGEPVRVISLRVEHFPAEVKLPPTPPMPVSVPVLNQYVDTLVATLQEEGFLYPGIDTEPTEDTSQVAIVVNAGPRTFISDVTLEGLSSIEESVAWRYIKLSIGAPYRLEDANLTKRELLRSGLFSRVEIVASDGKLDSEHENFTVRVSERALETLEVGTGANSEFGLHLFGEAVDKSFFADGRTLSARIDSYFDQARINPSGSDAISQGFANLRYQDPFFLNSQYSLTEELRFQRQELSTQEFDLERLLLASYVFRQIGSGVTFTGGHSLTFDNLLNVSPGAIISDLDEGHVRLSFLSGVLKLDRRDNPLTPTSGYTFTIEPRLSHAAIGSEADYAAILARTTGIVPLEFLSSRFSLGLGLTGGLAQPFGDTEQIPITQRFYLGGRTTVRGFEENSLGPRGEDGAVIGGDTVLAQKTQFDYLVSDAFSTHVFCDFGNVFLRHESFRLADIRSSTGVGFQYLSPIGPIGFDVGHPLDREPYESTFEFHFSVGSAF